MTKTTRTSFANTTTSVSAKTTPRCLTRQVTVGNVAIGAGAPVSIQTMLTKPATNVSGCLSDITKLAKLDCNLVRIALNNDSEAPYFQKICQASPLPIIADIQFDYKLAVSAMQAGAAKVRINPGNIGGKDKFTEVIKAAKVTGGATGTALRLGINSGSLDKASQNVVDSAKRAAHICEEQGFTNYVLSAKTSDSQTNIAANMAIAAELPNVPLHLGVTEAGLALEGAIKSAVSLSTLLQAGIGNTIRVSLTAPLATEIAAAKAILRCVGLYNKGFEIICCPTCSRTVGNVQKIAQQITNATNIISIPQQTKPIKIAVMGCVVNGPGEASQSDFGVALKGNVSGNTVSRKDGSSPNNCDRNSNGSGKVEKGVIFAKGRIIKTVTLDKVVSSILDIIL